MFLGKVVSFALRFVVDNEINVALTVQECILGTMVGDVSKTQSLKNRLEKTTLSRSKLNKLKSIKPHWVFK